MLQEEVKSGVDTSCYQGDLSVDQANKLDILLSHDEQTMAQFGGGTTISSNYNTRDRSLIEDSCDKKLRNDFYADGGPGVLMSTSRQSSLLAELNRGEEALNHMQDRIIDDDVDGTMNANQLIVYS